ncbi:peptidase inhibitor family I36 protein [Streptomyces sudanensis]|uniref:Peptidase inhibitor family I36 protein n=2 Tax=Streptomyces TaxID=1883 RepID=A0ABY4TH21_9ACTN|nr:peptidase inhibitor family I36 protein [Streptomyces sudanensis]URN17510.1 peptidase inhibitor family I36 protein [Streptomyces sudanensis]
MKMKHNRALLAAVFTAALLTPTTAFAANTEASAPMSEQAAAADGNLYAWEHAWKGGRMAAWSGNSSNWSDRNMRNQASSVLNNGYAGAFGHVRLYWDAGYGGASYCLRNGEDLMDMRYDYFEHNGAGGGQSMNDNVSSHRWVGSC